jgi:MFS family permease
MGSLYAILLQCSYIATSWGWQWCFLSPIGIALIGIILTYKCIKDYALVSWDLTITRKEYFRIISERVWNRNNK